MQLAACTAFACLGLLHVCRAAGNSNINASSTVKDVDRHFELPYSDFVATVKLGDQLPPWGGEWEDVANGILADADAAPFAFAGSAYRYDLWPRLTHMPDSKEEVRPTYLIRLSLEPGDDCATKQIGQDFLKAFANLFTQIAALEPGKRLDSEFSGTVDKNNKNYYRFKLQYTGRKPALSFWWQNYIDQPPLDLLNQGRKTILTYTKKKDMILCIGASGSYLFHTLNRPGEEEENKRTVYEIPLSDTKSWSKLDIFDVLHRHKDLEKRYAGRILQPSFDAWKRPMFGGGRLIFVVYVSDWQASTIRNLKGLMIEMKIWDRQIHLMSIITRDDKARRPEIAEFGEMPPIDMGSMIMRQRITSGGLPRITPPYPLPYWDLDPDQIDYPDKRYASGIINALRNNRPQIPPLPPLDTSNASTSNAVISFRERRSQSTVSAPLGSGQEEDDIDGDKTPFGMSEPIPWPVNGGFVCDPPEASPNLASTHPISLAATASALSTPTPAGTSVSPSILPEPVQPVHGAAASVETARRLRRIR